MGGRGKGKGGSKRGMQDQRVRNGESEEGREAGKNGKVAILCYLQCDLYYCRA